MTTRFTIRTATIADTHRMMDFYSGVDNPEQAPWIEILMDGRHPHTRAENFVLAEDNDSGKIAACAIQMPWTYLYDGLPIAVSRMEQVFTDTEYGGQGLMGQIFNQLHQNSTRRGDVMQVVYGRPGLYRHLGYSFALPNEEEGWLVSLPTVETLEPAPEFTISPAENTDLPRIVELYRQAAARYMVCTHMGLAEFQYARNVYPVESLDVVKDPEGQTVGFVRFLGDDVVYALELSPAVSYYRFRASFLWRLRSRGVQQAALKLGEYHPMYDVLDEFPQKKLLTLHGYARICDITTFLQAITPVLNRRLQASSYAGFDRSLVLCLHNRQESYRLNFEQGCLTGIEPVAQEYGDIYVIRDQLVKLLLGRLSLADLDRENAEVYFHHPDYRRMFGILFPAKPSFIYSIN